MTDETADRVRQWKQALKYVIADAEAVLGVDAALSVTMPALRSLESCEEILRR